MCLLSIDVLSRKCHVRLLKNKTASHVARALEAIVDEAGVAPSYVVTDRFPPQFVSQNKQRRT